MKKKVLVGGLIAALSASVALGYFVTRYTKQRLPESQGKWEYVPVRSDFKLNGDPEPPIPKEYVEAGVAYDGQGRLIDEHGRPRRTDKNGRLILSPH